MILPISDSTAIKLTTSRYYTPNERSIQAKGITPDVVVADTAEGDLFRFPREADLQRHLTNGQAVDAEVKQIDKEPDVADTSKIFQFGTPEDFQLQQAVNFLDGKPVEKAVLRAKADIALESTAAEGKTPKK